MPINSVHLQALLARRREIEHNRIERTEAVNKYFDHWGRVTARFENWTTPEYYKQAEQQLQTAKDRKEKEKKLLERQQKLAELLKMEKKNYEQELHEKERSRNMQKNVSTKTLEAIDENLKEQQKMRRKLDLEAKLYGKWRHGVDDDNLIFESKSDNEVMAKLNWLDKQVDQQIRREHEEKEAKEQELKLHQEINKSEQLQKERQQIRESEIREIRSLQEYHMEQLKAIQRETDQLKEREKHLRSNLDQLEKELELLEENYHVFREEDDFGRACNLNKIKISIRKRSEVFRNKIKLCISILERTLDIAIKPNVLENFKNRLEQQLNLENQKLVQIETMYESEAKNYLHRSEEVWQREHTDRHTHLKDILMGEHELIKSAMDEAKDRHEELFKIQSTHISVIENTGEKLKLLIKEEERAQQKAYDTAKHANEFEEPAGTLYPSKQHDTDESYNNNLSPRCYNSNDCNDINQASNSFNNLNMDGNHPSQRELESQKTNAQRTLQVVTAETEADRPRFGRKGAVWD